MSFIKFTIISMKRNLKLCKCITLVILVAMKTLENLPIFGTQSAKEGLMLGRIDENPDFTGSKLGKKQDLIGGNSAQSGN